MKHHSHLVTRCPPVARALDALARGQVVSDLEAALVTSGVPVMELSGAQIPSAWWSWEALSVGSVRHYQSSCQPVGPPGFPINSSESKFAIGSWQPIFQHYQ